MALVRVPRSWEIRENLVTAESAYLNRRHFLKTTAAIGGSLFLNGGLQAESEEAVSDRDAVQALYPPEWNPAYSVHLPMTEEAVAGRYNNFYEFTTIKEKVYEVAQSFETYPWTIELDGHCENKGRFDVDALIRQFGIEERVYRFRCVEAWAMVVPWSGFPLHKLIDFAMPTDKAQYVCMYAFFRSEEATGQKKQNWYPWPYFEGMRLDEARNELAVMATGIYGKEMPVQHGAPIRLVVPWKYGYKSIKSVVKIEFSRRQPDTFWNTLSPREYDFWSNVNPAVPHPRWSQATELMIGSGERLQTLKYNGYRKQVEHLYS